MDDGEAHPIAMKIVLMATLAAPLLASGAGWENISDAVTAKLPAAEGGPTGGVAVDRVSGDVFMVVSGHGLWKSADHGATFVQLDDGSVGGICATGWALQVDPNGGRLDCFMLHGGSAMTADGGKSWTKSQMSDFDCGAVDWEDTGKRLLAIRHESGALATSDDGGATWLDGPKGFSGCGVFDHQTFVVTRSRQKGIYRTATTGANWTTVSSDTPTAAVAVIFKGVAYWEAAKGILTSRDKGLTWSWLGAPVEASFGPYFGESENHFVVVGRDGFQETKDGGKTFHPAAPLPEGFGVSSDGVSYAWDPKADIFYASSVHKPAYKYQR